MLKSVKVLHIESTNACNAACPQCARELDKSFDKNNLHHLSVEQVQSLISEDIIKNLDKMFLCGNYGDPAAGRHTLEIFRYFRKVNPSIVLGMNTNGGLRSTSWWQELAGILNQPQDYVVFSIDGLEDTNHIYRVNVSWTKLVENAQAFTNAGGSAHWDMLVFDHNKHQVDTAKDTARMYGFTWFRAKVSKRFKTHPIEFLQPPKGWKNPIVENGTINCHAIHESSVYISAQGIIHPCCWLGHDSKNTLDQFDLIKQSWSSNSPNSICYSTCSKNTLGTSFTNQWQQETELT
jgi:MoaA/NifB/PqqE/SkfB family radical SAM enzyme